MPEYTDEMKIAAANLAIADPASFATMATLFPKAVREEIEAMVAGQAESNSFGAFDENYTREGRDPNTAVSVHSTLFNVAEDFVSVVKEGIENRGGGNKKKWSASLSTPAGTMIVVIKPNDEKKK